MKRLRVTFIGSGNVAWHLAPALENAGIPVKELYSPNIKNAEKLAEHLYDVTVKENLDFKDSEQKLFIIAVSDDAIEKVVRELVLPEGSILLHTSGTQPMQVLEQAQAGSIGVLYPLQTFSKDRKMSFEAIPFCLEASDQDTLETIRNIAGSLTSRVHILDSVERKKIHVAAVIACNFTNHLLSISKDFLEGEDLDFEILKPLVSETLSKALQEEPDAVQTGPARRNDLKTIEQHVSMLQQHSTWKQLYEIISNDIIKKYKE